MCEVDQMLQEPSSPALAPKPARPVFPAGVPPAPIQEAGNGDEPKIFRCLWRVDPFDAARILKKFARAGIQFEIEQFDIPEPTRSECIICGSALTKQIDVYVRWDDKEEAMEILAADWKV